MKRWWRVATMWVLVAVMAWWWHFYFNLPLLWAILAGFGYMVAWAAFGYFVNGGPPRMFWRCFLPDRDLCHSLRSASSRRTSPGGWTASARARLPLRSLAARDREVLRDFAHTTYVVTEPTNARARTILEGAQEVALYIVRDADRRHG
jgi:hypothetical protein